MHVCIQSWSVCLFLLWQNAVQRQEKNVKLVAKRARATDSTSELIFFKARAVQSDSGGGGSGGSSGSSGSGGSISDKTSTSTKRGVSREIAPFSFYNPSMDYSSWNVRMRGLTELLFPRLHIHVHASMIKANDPCLGTGLSDFL